MAKKPTETPVKGGWVKREAATGRFMEVRTGEGVSKATSASRSTVKEASKRRNAALKRLAER